MKKNCENCVKESIGCKEIQHLFRDVDKLKASKKLNNLLCFVFVVITVGFAVISILVWQNMLKQSISTANLKPEELKNMAELFNSQFSNLLTVLGILLTVFGVVIPIINAIYQKQTLKDERDSLRREIDINLANLEAKEKKLEDKIESTKEEREKQIAKVRSDLAQAIDSARKSFSEKQEKITIELEESQKQQTYNNGYFYQQLAFTNRHFLNIHCIYCSYAIMYYSVYAENNDEFAKRFFFIVEKMKEKLQEDNDNEKFYSEKLIENLKAAQRNVKTDSIYFYNLKNLIEIIGEWDKKKGVENNTISATEPIKL